MVSQQEKIQLLEDKSISLNKIHPNIYRVLKESLLPFDHKNLVILVDGNPKYVLKIDPSTSNFVNNVIINEAYIGLFELAKISDQKNFSKVLGANIRDSCYDYSTAPFCDYVMYEYVEGESLKDYIIGHDDALIIMKIIYESIHALYLAYEEIGFVHNDLHLNNIIIKPDTTPVFIDYGASQIRNDQQRCERDFKDCWKDDIHTLVKNILQEVSNLDDSNTKLKEIERDLQGGEDFMYDFLQEEYLRILEMREQRMRDNLQWYPTDLTLILQDILDTLQDSPNYEYFLHELEIIL